MFKVIYTVKIVHTCVFMTCSIYYCHCDTRIHRMQLCMFVCICVCVYVCMYVCMYVCTNLCMYVYVCVYVCMYVCMYVCIYVPFTYLCTKVHFLNINNTSIILAGISCKYHKMTDDGTWEEQRVCSTCMTHVINGLGRWMYKLCIKYSTHTECWL